MDETVASPIRPLRPMGLGWMIVSWLFTALFLWIGVWGQSTDGNAATASLIISTIFFALPAMPNWIRREQGAGRRVLYFSIPALLVAAFPVLLIVMTLLSYGFTIIRVIFSHS